MPYDEPARQAHKAHHGKLKTKLTMPITNKEELSIAYTPGVAAPCKDIAADKRKVYDYTIKGHTVAVITDGSAVLGLGNIGPEASLPVMEGKCALFKAFADIDAFPIALDTQDTEEIITAVKQLAPVFGGINLEDISSPRCFAIEERLKKSLDIPVFHDDQHGTAIVVLAGLINAMQITKRKKEEQKIIMAGAGAAGVAIAKLLLTYGFTNIIMTDRKGAIYDGRTENMNEEKEMIAKITNQHKEQGTLADVMQGADIFIGVSGKGLVTKAMVASMHKDPIIFAMANPDPEITTQDAKAAGASIIATGRSDYPNQVNNVLAFPGIFKGALTCKARNITEQMKLAAAEAIAGLVKEPAPDKIIPEPFEEGIAETVAKAVMQASEECRL